MSPVHRHRCLNLVDIVSLLLLLFLLKMVVSNRMLIIFAVSPLSLPALLADEHDHHGA